MASYLFEFYIGYLAWSISPRIAEISSKKSKTLTLLTFFCVLLWMCFYDHPGTGLISVLGMAAFLTLAGPCRWNGLKTVLNTPPLQFLGRISYSLYLIHLPILMICWSVFITRSKIMYSDLICLAILLLSMLPISVVLAGVIERYVERPFNALGHRISNGIKNLQVTSG